MCNESSFKFYSSVKESDVRWLWYPYIPLGKITLLQGDPGDGKSTFILNLAACLTRGDKLPDGSDIDGSMMVIYQCAEDSRSDTIKPRLMHAGADCNKIAFIEDDENSLTLEDSRLEQTIIATKASLVVLDPIQAFIPQDGDMQNASKMRTSLRKLAKLAERNNCAIVLVGHMNKSSSGKKLYRGLGSIDIAAIARSVLMISRDAKNPAIRYMFPVKSSLAPEGCAVGFTFDSGVGFQWIGKCYINIEEMDSQDVSFISKKDRAKELLNIMLSAGELPSVEIFCRMEKLGISERTVREAQKELQIRAHRKKDAWYWVKENEQGDLEED